MRLIQPRIAMLLEIDSNSHISEYCTWTSVITWPEMVGIRFRIGSIVLKKSAQGSPSFGASTDWRWASSVTAGTAILLLLGGGPKRTQDADIRSAVARWKDYRSRR